MRVTTKIKVSDMFLFQMYHTYVGITGLALVLLAGLALGNLIGNFNDLPAWSIGFWIFVMAWGIVLNPVILYFKSKKQVETTELFKNPIDIEIAEDGFGIYQGENGGVIDWKDITKIIILNKLVIFYMGKVRAHLLPLEENSEESDMLVELIKKYAKCRKFVSRKRRGK